MVEQINENGKMGFRVPIYHGQLHYVSIDACGGPLLYSPDQVRFEPTSATLKLNLKLKKMSGTVRDDVSCKTEGFKATCAELGCPIKPPHCW